MLVGRLLPISDMAWLGASRKMAYIRICQRGFCRQQMRSRWRRYFYGGIKVLYITVSINKL